VRYSDVHGERDQQQQHTEREGHAEITPSRLQHDRGRHHARAPLDVAAHHHDGAHFGHHGPEAGDQSGEEAEARLAQVSEQRPHARRAERARLQPHVRRHRLNRGKRDPGYIRPGEERLSQHHCRRCEEERKCAERPGPREQHIDEKADHYGWQCVARLDQRDHRVSASEAAESHGRPERDPHDGSEQ
jgi:hypothetical protein